MLPLLSINWNPDPELFNLFGISIRYYGLLWIVGLAFAYVIVQRQYRDRKIDEAKFDPLFFYCFFGILIGARLGHCLFYDWAYYQDHFPEMVLPIKILPDGSWKMTGYTGLASHGGTLGLIVALWLYCRKTKMHYADVLDMIAVATPVTACCIRLANLMNSEIIGRPTHLPWAFVFGRVDMLPRHPAQLYEAIAYLIFFLGMMWLYRRGQRQQEIRLQTDFGTTPRKATAVQAQASMPYRRGFFFGLCLTEIFTFRFFIEFLKENQVAFEDAMTLNMGQWLSLPFVVTGIYFMCFYGRKKNARTGTIACLTLFALWTAATETNAQNRDFGGPNRYAKEHKMPCADHCRKMATGENRALNPRYSKDGVHPDREGYAVMEKPIKETMLQAQAYQWEKAIAYRPGNNDEYVKQKCLLDVYYPEGKKDFPTVVWYHGGGLTGGDREIPCELRRQGIAVIGVSYRLCPDGNDPNAPNADITTDQCVDDAAAAAAWAMKNIGRYGGNPRKIYLAGHSAGGYLTAMIGLDKTRLAKYDVDADAFKALIPFSGQMITHFRNRHARGIPDVKPLIDEHAPLYHVRKDCPPILLISGDREREMLGRYEENAYLWRMLQVVGHPDARLYELDGFDHGSMARPAHYILLDYIRRQEQKK